MASNRRRPLFLQWVFLFYGATLTAIVSPVIAPYICTPFGEVAQVVRALDS